MPPSAARLRWQVLVTAIKTTIKHFTSKSYPKDWDLAFHLQLAILRRLDESMLGWTMEEIQDFSMGYLSEPKEGCAFPVSIELSEDDKDLVESEMRGVFQKLGPDLDVPEINAASVRAEWQGGINVEGKDENERYAKMLETTKDGPVILSLHGGGYVTGSAAMERTATFKLARVCGGRVFAVDYRLAPQEPFPAALLDAIVAYKYLVDPPPGALHSAVDPKKIIIGGNSAGGGLAIALTVFLLHTQPLFPMPGGVLPLWPLLDLTASFPSTRIDRGLEWVPCVWQKPWAPKPSKAWPPPKPLFGFYAEHPLHPLVSPIVLANELSSFPPIFTIVGDVDYLLDECVHFAVEHSKCEGKIQFQVYRSMPHAWVMFEKHPSTNTCYQELAKFAKAVCAGVGIETRMDIVNGKGQIEQSPLDPKRYPVGFSKSELIERMKQAIEERRMKGII